MNAFPPLADLHRHLDGSLRPQTLLELAHKAGRDVPADLCFYPAMGLDEALSRFAFTLSLLQEPETLTRVAKEICEDAQAEGVTTLEIRFAPQLHQGAGIDAIVDATLEGIDGRAGLILCGLYGEPPQVLDTLVTVAAHRPMVVGIDLAGGPAPNHQYGMRAYAPAFTRARELGLGRTVHAAEGRSVAEIRVAIEELHAQRIGHGTTLLDDPAVVDLVAEHQVTIEACPTSNIHTGVIDAHEQHPLPRWLELGIRACICPDNTLLSNVNSHEEHRRMQTVPGMNRETIERAIAWGHAAAFKRI